MTTSWLSVLGSGSCTAATPMVIDSLLEAPSYNEGRKLYSPISCCAITFPRSLSQSFLLEYLYTPWNKDMTNHSNIVHTITHSHTHYTHFIICTYTVEWKKPYTAILLKKFMSVYLCRVSRGSVLPTWGQLWLCIFLMSTCGPKVHILSQQWTPTNMWVYQYLLSCVWGLAS